jgi:hypothetical protein
LHEGNIPSMPSSMLLLLDSLVEVALATGSGGIFNMYQ